jgi:hypothetical protein
MTTRAGGIAAAGKHQPEARICRFTLRCRSEVTTPAFRSGEDVLYDFKPGRHGPAVRATLRTYGRDELYRVTILANGWRRYADHYSSQVISTL